MILDNANSRKNIFEKVVKFFFFSVSSQMCVLKITLSKHILSHTHSTQCEHVPERVREKKNLWMKWRQSEKCFFLFASFFPFNDWHLQQQKSYGVLNFLFVRILWMKISHEGNLFDRTLSVNATRKERVEKSIIDVSVC